jgi:hypothetical protein
MTGRRLAGEVLKQFAPDQWRQDMDDDADGEGVTADTGKVFSEQVGCSLRIAGCSVAHDFDVVAFPIHLRATGTLCRSSCKRAQIG